MSFWFLYPYNTQRYKFDPYFLSRHFYTIFKFFISPIPQEIIFKLENTQWRRSWSRLRPMSDLYIHLSHSIFQFLTPHSTPNSFQACYSTFWQSHHPGCLAFSQIRLTLAKYVVESLAGLRSPGAERIYRCAPAATDCHLSCTLSRASGSLVRPCGTTARPSVGNSS